MPYFRDPNLEQKDQTGQVQLQGGDFQADPSGSPSDASQPKSSNTGSHFQNLDSYLKNNDAASAGQKFGQNVQNSIDEARKTIDTTAGEVKGQINAGANPATQAQITSAVQGAGAGTTPEQAKQYQDWTTQSYTGPHSLAEAPGAQSKVEGSVNSAQTKARLAGTEAGRFALLDQYYGRPSYNFGEKSLDNLLVQGGGGFTNQPQLQDQAAQLGAYGAQQAKGIQQAASERAGQYDQSRTAARQAIGLQEDNTIKGGPIEDLTKDIDSRIQSKTLADQQLLAAYSDELKRGSSTEEHLKQLGLTPGTQTWGEDLSKWLSPGGPETKLSVANNEDYKRYLALAGLAGIQPTYLTPDQQAQYNKTGAAAPNGPSFQMDQFKTAADADQYRYDQARAANPDLDKYQTILDSQTAGQKDPYGDSLGSLWAKGASLGELRNAYQQANPGVSDSDALNAIGKISNLRQLRDELAQFDQRYGKNKTLSLIGGNPTVTPIKDFSGLLGPRLNPAAEGVR